MNNISGLIAYFGKLQSNLRKTEKCNSMNIPPAPTPISNNSLHCARKVLTNTLSNMCYWDIWCIFVYACISKWMHKTAVWLQCSSNDSILPKAAIFPGRRKYIFQLCFSIKRTDSRFWVEDWDWRNLTETINFCIASTASQIVLPVMFHQGASNLEQPWPDSYCDFTPGKWK